MVTKRKNITFELIIVAMLLWIGIFLFLSQCNGKRNSNTIAIDTMKVYVAKVEKRNIELQKENDSLMAEHVKDLKEIEIIKEQQAQSACQVSILIQNIKELPIDSSVKLMALNFVNKQQIKTRVEGKDTLIGIHPSQVTEVNITHATLDFYKADNEYLNQELQLMISSDSSLVQIIINQNEMLKSKDGIISADKTIETQLRSDLDKMTKKFKRQRFMKFVFKGGFFAAVVYSILK
jgi:hypothetical protein